MTLEPFQHVWILQALAAFHLKLESISQVDLWPSVLLYRFCYSDLETVVLLAQCHSFASRKMKRSFRSKFWRQADKLQFLYNDICGKGQEFGAIFQTNKRTKRLEDHCCGDALRHGPIWSYTESTLSNMSCSSTRELGKHYLLVVFWLSLETLELNDNEIKLH